MKKYFALSVIVLFLFLIKVEITLSTDLLSIDKITPYNTYLNISGNLYVSSTNVGIGTSTPGAMLDVTGNVKFNGYQIAKVTDSTSWTGSAPELFTPLGKFGYYPGAIRIIASDIGCNLGGSMEFYITPTYDSGAEDIKVYSLGDTDEFPTSESRFTFYVERIDASSFYLGVAHNGGCTDSSKSVTYYIMGGNFDTSQTDPNKANYVAMSTRKYIYQTDNGNVGIGTTSPSSKLHVVGGATITNGLTVSGGTVSLPNGQINNAEISELDWTKLQNYPTACGAGQAVQAVGDTLTCIDVNPTNGITGSGTANRLAKFTGANTIGNSGISDSSDALAITIDSSERVGIGTTSPGTTLDVNGDIRVRGADIQDAGGTSRITITDNGRLDLKEDNGNVALSIDTTGNVGIGTTSPGAKLDVNGGVKVDQLETDVLNNIVPFYIRGTGANDNANRILKIGSTTIYNTGGRGLRLTIINKSDHSIISDTLYDTYGSTTASDNMATALAGMTDGQVGIITSYDAWTNSITTNLRNQFKRLGLFKAFKADNSLYRSPYATIFEAASNGEATDKALEVLMDDSGLNQPYAEIRGWLIDGSFVATGEASNVVTNVAGTDVALIADVSGNVGIGTTSPGDKLDINGNVRIRSGLIKDNSGDTKIDFSDDASTAQIVFSGSNLIIKI